MKRTFTKYPSSYVNASNNETIDTVYTFCRHYLDNFCNLDIKVVDVNSGVCYFTGTTRKLILSNDEILYRTVVDVAPEDRTLYTILYVN